MLQRVGLIPLEKHSALSGISEEYSATGEIPGQKGDRDSAPDCPQEILKLYAELKWNV